MNKSHYTIAKQRVSMLDILMHYLDDYELAAYRTKGVQMRGLCILCDTQKYTTLSINTDKNCYQSFCCKSKGNILDFVSAKEGIKIPEALALIIEWFDLGDDQAPVSSDKEPPRAVHAQTDTVNKPLAFELKNIDHGHEKVIALGISEKTAALFGVGHYPGRGMFKDHVVFPIHDSAGQLIAYAGIDGKESDYRYPKNFQRDHGFYNMHRVTKSLVSNSGPIIVVNGFLEVLWLYEQGVHHAVSSMSEKTSSEQMQIISEMSHSSSQAKQVAAVHDAQAGYAMSDDEILARGADILESRMKTGPVMAGASDVKEYLKRKLSHLEREVFVCLYLDNKNQLITFEELFKGTVNQATVYPREIVKQALKLNACAIIVGHNHPSGKIEPSDSDRSLTDRIKKSLEFLDLHLLDHVIVGGDQAYSFAEEGLI